MVEQVGQEQVGQVPRVVAQILQGAGHNIPNFRPRHSNLALQDHWLRHG